MKSREIKFKAYLTELEKMIPASQVLGFVMEPVDSNGTKDLILKYSHLPENICISEENSGNYILLQFTGFKDKNDKEIYEGDIIEDVLQTGLYGIVNYGEYTNCFDRDEIKFGGHIGFFLEFPGKFKHGTRKDLKYWANNSKVIGNIYDNPFVLQNLKVENPSN